MLVFGSLTLFCFRLILVGINAQVGGKNLLYMGASKNKGKHPKMEGLFHGKPYEQMDDFGGAIILGNTHMVSLRTPPTNSSKLRRKLEQKDLKRFEKQRQQYKSWKMAST